MLATQQILHKSGKGDMGNFSKLSAGELAEAQLILQRKMQQMDVAGEDDDEEDEMRGTVKVGEAKNRIVLEQNSGEEDNESHDLMSFPK